MSWTEITITLNVDGDKEAAMAKTADMLETVCAFDGVIGGMGEVGTTHVDECDGYPCTCREGVANPVLGI